MRTTPHAITGRRVLALALSALALGAISVGLDAATASGPQDGPTPAAHSPAGR